MQIEIDFLAAVVFFGLPSAFTGFCFWGLKKYLDKKELNRSEQDKAKEKNEFLIIKSVGAALALGEATAHAIRDGKCNGEMSAALEYAQEVKHEQKNFITEQGIRNLY
ncbi:MAG: serine/threonine protein kinase [Oscillospiraceae bacterium]